MTITLSGLSNGRVGPGVSVVLTTSTSGPYPTDDWMDLRIEIPSSFIVICYGTRSNQFSTHTMDVTLGVLDPIAPIAINPLILDAVAAGSTVDMYATYQHHSGVVVDGPTLVGSASWDPVSALWVVSGGQGGTSLLNLIYQAVHKLYPAT